MEDTLYRTKQVIREEVERAGLEVRRVLLFGSRARGVARPDSDWDFYVILNADVDRKTRRQIASRIASRLAQEGIFVDLFLQSERVVQERAGDTGYLTYYVLKEGVPV